MNGLSSGEARPGDHALISVTPPVGVTFTSQSWGVGTFGDTTYGTGSSPTDYTASDGLTLRWEGIGDDGKTYRASALIRYAIGTFNALTNQSFIADAGDETYQHIVATGTGLTWTYAATDLITGVTYNAGTRTFTFDTDALDVQSGTVFGVTATDQYGRAATGSPQTFTLDIALRTQATAADGLGPFSWTVDDTTVNVNAAADFTLNGNTLTYTATGLPTGVTMNTSGVISGTPSAASSGSIVITGTDEYGRQTTSTTSHTTSLRAQATGGVDLDLAFPEDSLIPATNLIQNWTTNGNSLSFVSVSPALPTGLSVNINGILQGTPTTVTADATYTLTMGDEYGRETSDTFALEITVVGDVTAPTATGITAGTQTNGNLPVEIADLDENSTMFWVLVPNLATAPNSTEIIAGQASGGGAPSDSGNVAVTVGTGPYDFDLAAGLSGSFDLYTVFRDASLNVSTVYSDTGITLDTAPPVISAVTVTPGDTQLTVAWSTDTGSGTARIVAVPNGDTAPTATEVLNGQASGGGVPTADSGVINPTATGAQTAVVLADLVNNVALDVYIAHRDLQLNVATPTADLNNTPAGVGWDVTAGNLSATINTFPTFSTTSWTVNAGNTTATVTVFPLP